MFPRLGLSLAAALTGAAVALGSLQPAHAVPGWARNDLNGMPFSIPWTTQLPADSTANYTAPFPSYMYDSILLRSGSNVRVYSYAGSDVLISSTPPSAHVAWCKAHFRSYNQASDSYLGFDGNRHRCVSPY
jgi:hypothetical protein